MMSFNLINKGIVRGGVPLTKKSNEKSKSEFKLCVSEHGTLQVNK